MPYHVLVKKKFTVAALDVFADNWATSCPALEFLQQAYNDSNTLASCKGFRALFELLASVGPSGLTSAMMHEANKE